MWRHNCEDFKTNSFKEIAEQKERNQRHQSDDNLFNGREKKNSCMLYTQSSGCRGVIRLLWVS
jgi:hypothetical protein